MITDSQKVGPKQYEKFLLNLENQLKASPLEIREMEILHALGTFPPRLKIVPSTPKGIDSIPLLIDPEQNLPITIDKRQSCFYVDVDIEKFSAIRIDVLATEHNSYDETITIRRRFDSSKMMKSSFAMKKQTSFRHLMVADGFDDLALEETQNNAVVKVIGSISRLLQFGYEFLDRYNFVYNSFGSTLNEIGKDGFYVTLDDHFDYLNLVKSNQKTTGDNRFQNIFEKLDIRKMNNEEQIRLLTAYIDPVVVKKVAEILGMVQTPSFDFSTQLASFLSENDALIVSQNDFFLVEGNVIKPKQLNFKKQINEPRN